MNTRTLPLCVDGSFLHDQYLTGPIWSFCVADIDMGRDRSSYRGVYPEPALGLCALWQGLLQALDAVFEPGLSPALRSRQSACHPEVADRHDLRRTRAQARQEGRAAPRESGSRMFGFPGRQRSGHHVVPPVSALGSGRD